MARLINFCLKLLIILGIPLTIGWFTYEWINGQIYVPIDKNSKASEVIEVLPQQTLSDVAQTLEDQGIIKSALVMNIIGRIQGRDKKIRVGEYKVSKAYNVYEILRIVSSGQAIQRVVTIPEGYNVSQVVDELVKAEISTEEELLRTLRNTSLLKKYGVLSSSFEGYLFPDTYHFPKGINPEDIILVMVQESNKRWKQEYSDRAEELGFDRNEILTLASIIEKESGNTEEQPIISSVFHNRLNEGMMLQSDPTVIYGIKNFDGNLTKRHLQTRTPYNTYVIKGLPPTPIANPGEHAIRAALYPAETAYRFFVGNGEGSHIFSENYRDHVNAVNKYQKRQK